MATKSTSRYVCQSCGDDFLRWEGQCRSCGTWNSLVETVVRTPARGKASSGGVAVGPGRGTAVALADIGEADVPRLATDIGELDRVLGGGIVPGSLVLVGGEPGIGKSTLLLQVAAGIGQPVLYATGEESAAQVRLRAGRLGLLEGDPGRRVEVLAEHDVGSIVEVARQRRPALVIVDSIQTATVDELDGAAGSVGQVREFDRAPDGLRQGRGRRGRPRRARHQGRLHRRAQDPGAPGRCGHRRRGRALRGAAARPRAKNRFGSTEEVGVFEMAGAGLLEVDGPARVRSWPSIRAGAPAASSRRRSRAPGRCSSRSRRSSRRPGYGTPARKASGLDPNRLGLLVAVLGRRAGIGLGHP